MSAEIRPGKVLLVGEAMGLFTAGEEGPCSQVGAFQASVAGAELNVALGLQRLGHHPLYATRLGSDILGQRIIHFMRENGLNTSLVKLDDRHSTGFMMKSKEHKGDPKTYYFRKESAASTIDRNFVRSLDITGASVLHLTGILPPLSPSCLEASDELIALSRKHNLFVSFDPNLRPALWDDKTTMRDTLRQLASHADLVLPGIAEGRELFGVDSVEETAQAFLDNGSTMVVVKDGPRGAYATNGRKACYIPGFVVNHVVDTVGCGDGFAAGVLSALLEDATLEAATERGCALGAIQTQHISDNEGLPTREKLDTFMTSHNRANTKQTASHPHDRQTR